MDEKLIKKVEETFIMRNPDIRTGDTVKIHLRIVEGGKERIQIFEGVVIAIKGIGLGKTITVRKISYGIGVEKIFPINTPSIKKIDIVERGDVRRSKLYYMRKVVGKRALDAGSQDGFAKIMEKEDGAEVPDEMAEGVKREAEENVSASAGETNEEPAGTASSDKKKSSDATAPADGEKVGLANEVMDKAEIKESTRDKDEPKDSTEDRGSEKGAKNGTVKMEDGGSTQG